MFEVSGADRAVIAAAIDKTKDNVPRTLDPADKEDAAAIASFLKLTGKTRQSHPALFDDLDAAAKSGAGKDDDTQALQIVDAGQDAQGRATCRAWHVDKRGALMSGSLALALDSDTGDIAAMGHANRVGGGYAPAATRSATAKAAPANMTSVGFYHSQAAPGTPPRFGMVANTQAIELNAQAVAADVTDPVIKVSGHTEIEIGLGRPQTGLDLDYFYNQDTSNTPILLVPFTGTVNVQQPLNYVDPNTHQFTQGLSVTTQLYSVSAQHKIDHQSSQGLLTQITGDTSTNVVTWSYPFDAASQMESLQFPPYGPARDTLSGFYFQFNIPVNNPVAPTFTFNVCSYDWPDQPSVNCIQIPNIKFWWHCIAAEASVTMADGAERVLEEVDNTARVRTVHGGSLGVEATTRALHNAGATPHPVDLVFELMTKSGLSVILTGGHPVVTPDGLAHTCDLKPGDAVLTRDGTDSVASCEESRYDGIFCNLKLVDETDREAGRSLEVGTFYANGIAVGDFNAMAQLHRNNTRSLEYMRARLPERYHTDYASTLEMIAHDNVKYGGNF